MNILMLVLALSGWRTDPKDGRELLRAMHDRYNGKWYKTLTFVQNNTAYLPGDSVQHSQWFERARIPGFLRIDFRIDAQGKPTSGGALFARDSQFNVTGDTVGAGTAFIHPLMVLGFDVYSQPIERTISQMQTLGYDLAILHADTWQNRPVWVVGAPAGDVHHKQFWVDQERLVCVRVISPGQRDTTRTSDILYNDYRPAGQGWVAAQMLFSVDGQRRWLEEYVDIKTDTPVSEAVFDLKQWKATK